MKLGKPKGSTQHRYEKTMREFKEGMKAMVLVYRRDRMISKEQARRSVESIDAAAI